MVAAPNPPALINSYNRTFVFRSMHIIPVIDLLRGQVVRGIRGERQHYAPIESPLCGSSDPREVVPILLDYAAADTLYVADLDALTGGAVQAALLSRLLKHDPGLTLWLDAGFADATAFDALCGELARLGADAERVVPVFASESLASPAQAAAALRDRTRSILSLDRHGEETLDPAGLWRATALWPQRLILMALERVGAYDGPALELLQSVRAQAPGGTRLVGAGGIRHADDLTGAAAAGADAWLVASALHDRRIPRAQG